MRKSLRSKNSIIDPKAQIGKNVKIGDYTKISSTAVIGDNVAIGDRCKIGFDDVIKEDFIIKQNPYYVDFVLANKCVIGNGATVCDGAYVYNKVIIGNDSLVGNNAYIRGNTMIGSHAVIGFSAYIGPFVEIGDNSLVLNYSAIGSTSKIGKNVFISPSVMLAENKHMTMDYTGRRGPIIGDYVRIGALSTIVSCNVGNLSVIGANSVVTKDLPEGSVYVGKRLQKVNSILLKQINRHRYSY
ncbi:MAG: hypothetical protein JW919_02015 [Candidatus Omnitrophica bacterium]|nr:hypothetical protein [Candidatus Omnitrophota bacterium]